MADGFWRVRIKNIKPGPGCASGHRKQPGGGGVRNRYAAQSYIPLDPPFLRGTCVAHPDVWAGARCAWSLRNRQIAEYAKLIPAQNPWPDVEKIDDYLHFRRTSVRHCALTNSNTNFLWRNHGWLREQWLFLTFCARMHVVLKRSPLTKGDQGGCIPGNAHHTIICEIKTYCLNLLRLFLELICIFLWYLSLHFQCFRGRKAHKKQRLSLFAPICPSLNGKRPYFYLIGIFLLLKLLHLISSIYSNEWL